MIDRNRIPKTPHCLWCDHWGSGLRERCSAFGGEPKYECVDKKACDARIKSAILRGP